MESDDLALAKVRKFVVGKGAEYTFLDAYVFLLKKENYLY